jgi:hypothetical protein
LSIIGYSIMALVIWWNKELQVHPMKLILYIAMVDTALSLISFTSYNICAWKIYEFFSHYVYFRTDWFAYQRSLWVINVSANYFSVFLIFMSIMLNACLAVDLILMLKHPFKSKEARIPLYLVSSIAVTVFITTAWLMTVYKSPVTSTIVPAKWVLKCAILIIILQLLVSIYSVIYALWKLCKPGISKESRRLVLIRHILSIVFFNISQAYLIITLITWIFLHELQAAGFNVYNNKWIGISKILFASQGIYLPILRLVEPFFFKMLK